MTEIQWPTARSMSRAVLSPIRTNSKVPFSKVWYLRLVGSTLTAEGPLYETLADYPLEA